MKRRLASEEHKDQESESLKTKSAKFEGETSFTALNICNKILNMMQNHTGKNFIKIMLVEWIYRKKKK